MKTQSLCCDVLKGMSPRVCSKLRAAQVNDSDNELYASQPRNFYSASISLQVDINMNVHNVTFE